MQSPILIAGLTQDQLLAQLEDPDFEEMVFIEEPIIFQIGSSNILAQLTKSDNEMSIEISHIEGGGEGVLLTLNTTIKRYCKQRGIEYVSWYIFATDCVNPNPKLGKVLLLRGYEIVKDNVRGAVYYKRESVPQR